MIGFLINLACFLIYYYLFPSLHTTTVTVYMIVLFLLIFPAIFTFAAYRYLYVSMMRTAFIKLSPSIQKLMFVFTGEVIKYKEEHTKGERQDKVFRLGVFLSDKFENLPGLVKRPIINKLDEVPITKYIKKFPAKDLVPGNENKVSEELFTLTNAFVLSELFPSQPKFLYWLIPLNVVFFILSMYFFS